MNRDQVPATAKSPNDCLDYTIWEAGVVRRSKTVPSALQEIMDWIDYSIVTPNRELGRSGPVCPFVAPALQQKTFWLSMMSRHVDDDNELSKILIRYLELYQSLKRSTHLDNDLATLIVVFPNFTSHCSAELVTRAHENVKPLVVEAGLMLGEFHPDSISPGLHNPLFYPLRSPMPLFVFRQMVAGDLPFLNKSIDPPEKRIRFINAYLKSLEGRLPVKYLDAALNCLSLAEAEAATKS